MSATEDAYLAGIIDGEGSIVAGLRTRPGSARLQIEVRLNVCNTNAELMAWTAAHYGGRHKRVERAAPWHDLHRLDWESRGMVPVLEAALPYLIVKRERAEWAIELGQTATQTFGRGGYPAELRDRRVALVGLIRAANRPI